MRIIQTIREQPGVSRADLARESDLAKSTVSSVVDELVQSLLLQETGSKMSSQGRRPVGLSFNASSRAVVGISIDHNRFEIAICNLDGVFNGVRTRKLSRLKDMSKFASVLLSELQKLLTSQNMELAKIGGVGLAVPGPLTPDYEKLQELLSKELNCPLLIDSNTNMAAFGESRLGAARNINDALVVRLGYEVRSALIIGNKLFKGSGGRAGELGHLTVPGNNRFCKCGKQGCINASASIDAIIDGCRESGLKVADIDEVIRSGLGGEVRCKEVLRIAGKSIGYGIASCLNLLAPSNVIITGQLVEAGKLILDPIQEALVEHATTENFSNCNLIIGDMQNHIEAVGASLAVLFQENFLMNLISRNRN